MLTLAEFIESLQKLVELAPSTASLPVVIVQDEWGDKATPVADSFGVSTGCYCQRLGKLAEGPDDSVAIWPKI